MTSNLTGKSLSLPVAAPVSASPDRKGVGFVGGRYRKGAHPQKIFFRNSNRGSKGYGPSATAD